MMAAMAAFALYEEYAGYELREFLQNKGGRDVHVFPIAYGNDVHHSSCHEGTAWTSINPISVHGTFGMLSPILIKHP